MGEIAEMVLDGLLCEQCGEYIGDGLDAGYPRLCAACAVEAEEEAEETDHVTHKES